MSQAKTVSARKGKASEKRGRKAQAEVAAPLSRGSESYRSKGI